MRSIRIACVLLLALSLQGCWAVFIPGSVVDAAADGMSGAKGKHCVASTAKVGDSILINGTVWRVKNLEGSSYRCKQPEYPIRAELDPA